MKFMYSLMLGLLLVGKCFAGSIVDVFGTSPKQADDIVEHYGKQIGDIESNIQNFEQSLDEQNHFSKSKVNQDSQKEYLNHLYKQRSALLDQIKQRYNLLFVDTSTFHYVLKNKNFTTIEVIAPAHPERLAFSHIRQPFSFTKTVSKKDLIYQMIQYQEILRDLLQRHKLSQKDIPTPDECPAYHCLAKFDHPRLKPYLSIFNQGAVREKTLILNTLKNDADPERRGAAVFLIAHMANPRQIINYLIPYINDKEGEVTNNVMRVIGITMEKAKIYDIDLQPFFKMLKSTSGADRNKALLVIDAAVQSPDVKRLVTQQIGDTLLDLLRLKQPNNHGLAYSILKSISGQAFSEYDLAAWEKWLKSTQA